jgi:flagellar biosynthetic protein FliR
MTFEQLHIWLMAFIRSGGLLLLAPVFSGKMIPIPIRIAIAAFLAYVVSGLARTAVPVPVDIAALVFSAGHELLIGLMMGLGMRLVFFALEFAGQLISTEVGLMMSAQIDPISQSDSTPIGSALFYLGSLIFLISGAHHAMFAAFLRSFELAPVGTVAAMGNIGELFVHSTGNIFLIALQMAAPIMAINFIVNMTFAILGKAAPGVNVFVESAVFRIIAGMTLLGLTLGLTAQLVLSQLRQAPELMLRLIP